MSAFSIRVLAAVLFLAGAQAAQAGYNANAKLVNFTLSGGLGEDWLHMPQADLVNYVPGLLLSGGAYDLGASVVFFWEHSIPIEFAADYLSLYGSGGRGSEISSGPDFRSYGATALAGSAIPHLRFGYFSVGAGYTVVHYVREWNSPGMTLIGQRQSGIVADVKIRGFIDEHIFANARAYIINGAKDPFYTALIFSVGVYF